METKHTPEPWRHEADDGALAEYIYAGDMLIAELSWTYFNGPSGETQFANAELIAAAPATASERDRLLEINKELIEAFKKIVANIEVEQIVTGRVWPGLSDFRCLITKATER